MEFKSFTSFPPTHRKDDWRETARQRHSTLASGTLRNTAMHRQCNERAKQSCDYARWSAASSAIRSSSRRVVAAAIADAILSDSGSRQLASSELPMLGHPQLQDARTADRTTVGCGRQWRWPARSQPCRLRACRCPLPRCGTRTVHLGFHWLRAATWATPSSPQLGRPLDDTPRARRRKLRSFRSVLRAHSSGQGNTLTVGAATKKSLKLSTVEAPNSWHAPARLFGWRAEPSLGPRPPKPRDLLCAILYAPRTVITRRCTTAPDSLGFRGFVKEIRSRKSFSCSCAKPRRRCELRAMAGVDSNVHPSGPSSSTELLCKADALPTTTRIYSKASAEPGDPHDTWARNPMIGEGSRGNRNPAIQPGSQAVKHPIPAGSPARSPPSARVLAPACASGGSAAAPSATSAEAATPWRPLRLGQVPPPRPRGQPPRRLVQGPPPDEMWQWCCFNKRLKIGCGCPCGSRCGSVRRGAQGLSRAQTIPVVMLLHVGRQSSVSAVPRRCPRPTKREGTASDRASLRRFRARLGARPEAVVAEHQRRQSPPPHREGGRSRGPRCPRSSREPAPALNDRARHARVHDSNECKHPPQDEQANSPATVPSRSESRAAQSARQIIHVTPPPHRPSPLPNAPRLGGQSCAARGKPTLASTRLTSSTVKPPTTSPSPRMRSISRPNCPRKPRGVGWPKVRYTARTTASRSATPSRDSQRPRAGTSTERCAMAHHAGDRGANGPAAMGESEAALGPSTEGMLGMRDAVERLRKPAPSPTSTSARRSDRHGGACGAQGSNMPA